MFTLRGWATTVTAQPHCAARDTNRHRDRTVGRPELILQPQDLPHSSHRHSLGRHRSPSHRNEKEDRSPAQRSGNTTPSGAADLRWEWPKSDRDQWPT